LRCWTCGGEYRKRDYPLHQGGKPQFYCAQEVETVGDVGHKIPQIYAIMDNVQHDHQASIIEMEGKLCD